MLTQIQNSPPSTTFLVVFHIHHFIEGHYAIFTDRLSHCMVFFHIVYPVKSECQKHLIFTEYISDIAHTKKVVTIQ